MRERALSVAAVHREKGLSLRTLGDLEAAVMDVIWQSDDPQTVRQVLEQVRRKSPLAYTTIQTVMDNLHRKKVLLRRREGRAFAYWPTKQRADYMADLMNELLSDSGDRSTTLLRFVGRMSPAEVTNLRDMLDDE